MVIVLAAGAGKTTVGRQLSEELRWPFLDGDEVHPLENITKMGRGTPLTDEDRRPLDPGTKKVDCRRHERGSDLFTAHARAPRSRPCGV